jgi:hypothetical protein
VWPKHGCKTIFEFDETHTTVCRYVCICLTCKLVFSLLSYMDFARFQLNMCQTQMTNV